MELNKVIKAARQFAEPYAVTGKGKFRLKDFDPGDKGSLQEKDKPRAKEALQMGVEGLAELQEMLYAQDRWSLLLVFQAMDAAGKDGAIKHVMSGVNLRVARSCRSSRPRQRSSTTTICGAAIATFPSVGGSAPSIARTTKRFSCSRASAVTGEPEGAAVRRTLMREKR